MANTKSAEKRIRTSLKKRAMNRSQKSALKTTVKRAELAIAENDPNLQVHLHNTITSLDKAAAKGLIHKNKAARKKSRLMKRIAANQG
ncbi:MAG TPA: 30S ribosomal protein S20 [Firmicutes bacterium]|nr:30S ribosomal protein S20 [Bacillota bacterium]